MTQEGGRPSRSLERSRITRTSLAFGSAGALDAPREGAGQWTRRRGPTLPHELQHGGERDRGERGARDVVDLVQHAAQRPPLAGGRAGLVVAASVRADLLEELHDVHERHALHVAAEAVAAAGAPHRLDEPGPPERAQHLREVVHRDPEPLGDLRRGELLRGVVRELERRVQREPRRDLELHGSSLFSSWMKGPPIMPRLRKNESRSCASLASIVRTCCTPAFRKRRQISSKRRDPSPWSRALGLMWIAKIQPEGGDPNSQARTSPTMKPSMSPSRSATRKNRSGCRPAYQSKRSFQYAAFATPVFSASSATTAGRSVLRAGRTRTPPRSWAAGPVFSAALSVF